MIRSTLLACAIAALGNQALALSCLRPDVARSYNEAAAAAETYVVVHGRLSFDATKLPDAGNNDSPPSTLVPAQLTGTALSASGFDHPFDRAVMLDVRCFGPWCGGAATGAEYLAFVERGEDGYMLEIDPCGSLAFAKPTEEMLAKVTACFSGKPCNEGR